MDNPNEVRLDPSERPEQPNEEDKKQAWEFCNTYGSSMTVVGPALEFRFACVRMEKKQAVNEAYENCLRIVNEDGLSQKQIVERIHKLKEKS